MNLNHIILFSYPFIVLLSLVAIIVGLIKCRKKIAGANAVSSFAMDMIWTLIPFVIVFVLLIPSLWKLL